MAELTFAESYRTHGFRVEIEGTSCQATKVTGLNEGHTDVIEMASGGDAIVRKIASGIVKFDNLTIERDMDGTQEDALFQTWFSEMFQLTGASNGSSIRRNAASSKASAVGPINASPDKSRWKAIRRSTLIRGSRSRTARSICSNGYPPRKATSSSGLGTFSAVASSVTEATLRTSARAGHWGAAIAGAA